MAIPRFAKMAANLDGHPKVRKAGRNAREVFLFVLRKNAELDRSGRVPLDRVEPWFLADQLMMSESEAQNGLDRAVSAGLLMRSQTEISICGWDDEWAKAPLTEAERKAKQRKEQQLTIDVTDMSGHDRDSPESHTSEENRREEIRGEESIGSAANAGGHQPSPSPAPVAPKARRQRKQSGCGLPEGWAPGPRELSKARDLGVDGQREAEHFRDHHKSKGSLFVDWDAAFRTWLGNAQRFAANRGSYATRQSPTETVREMLRELDAREADDVPHAAEVSS